MKKAIILFLKMLACIPFGILYFIADIAYFVIYYIARYRRKTVRKNLTEAFPQMSGREIHKIEKQFYHFLCDVMVETIKLLHVRDKELKERVTIDNVGNVNESLEAGTSAVILLGHYGNWEWVQEISPYLSDKAVHGSIYHEMNHTFWDDIFLKIRSRWKATLLPRSKAVRFLLDRNNSPWVFGFIADQRPSLNNPDTWTMFLNHDTDFISGPEDIGNKVKADFFYLDVERTARGHYKMSFNKLEPLKDDNPYPVSRAFWGTLEKTVRRDPALWLWSHNRWKHNRSTESTAGIR